MPKTIEEQLIYCKRCKRETIHRRNAHTTGLLMFLVHIVLTLITFGAWLVLIVIWKVLNTKIGGWKCSECR